MAIKIKVKEKNLERKIEEEMDKQNIQ